MAVFVTGLGCWPAPELGGSAGFAPSVQPASTPLPKVARKDVLPEQDMAFGRMDDYCRLGLLACSRALQAAGVHSLQGEAERRQPTPCGMVAATVWGCLGTDVAYLESCRAPEGGSPHLFAYTLPSIVLGEAALRFGLRGPSLALQLPPGGDAPFDSLAPLTAALDFILAGDALSMLAGFCEIGLPPALAGDAAVGRGACFLLLEKSPPPAYALAQARIEPTKDGGLVCGGAAAASLQDVLARLAS